MIKWTVFISALLIGSPLVAYLMTRGELFQRLILIAFLVLLMNDLNGGLSINVVSYEWYRGSSRGLEITALDLISLGLFLHYLRLLGPLFLKPLITPLGLLLLFYVSSNFISTFLAVMPEYAVFGFWKILRGLLTFLLFYHFTDSVERCSFLIYCFAFMCLYQLPVVLKQKYLMGIYRVTGTLPHMNSLAQLMNLLSLPCLSASLYLGKLSHPVFLIASGAAAFTVISTASRGALVCLIGCGALVFLNFRPRFLKLRQIAYLFLIVSAVIIGGWKASDTIIHRFNNAPKESKQTRVDLNVCARKMADDFLFGVGLNNYSHMIGQTSYGDDAPNHPEGGKDDGVAHHIYWLLAAELGYPGLAIFIMLIFGIQLRTLQLAVQARNNHLLALGVGVFAGMMSLHLQGFLEWILRQTNVWFLFCAQMGMVEAALRINKKIKRKVAK